MAKIEARNRGLFTGLRWEKSRPENANRRGRLGERIGKS